jgi:hypothetical protein
MRKAIIVLFLLIIPFYSFSQMNSETGITKIKMYMMRWNVKYRIVPEISNIKDNYEYYFESNGSYLRNMFIDYQDCDKKLKSQRKLGMEDMTIAYVCVELFFKRKKITLYFCDEIYNYKGNWYEMHPGLYYYLFFPFSNSIISNETLNKAKENKKRDIW